MPAHLAPRDQRQIATHNEYGKRHGHQKRAHPEAPVAVHSMPVRTWVRLTVVAAMSFVEVPVSCHIASGYIVAFGFKAYGLAGAITLTGAAAATGTGGSATVVDELIAGAGVVAGISVPAG